MYVVLEAYGHLDAGCCVIYIAVLSNKLGTVEFGMFLYNGFILLKETKYVPSAFLSRQSILVINT